MASAKLELVRSIFAAWERGDFSATAWAHPQIAYAIADGPAPGNWTGPAGMVEGVREQLNAWEEMRIEADEYRELDGERVLVLLRFSGRGKTSGLEVAHMRAEGAGLFHIADAKVTKYSFYWDRDRAFADLGLAAESDAS
jgi:ketosteroid isomerase-like protein